MSSNVVVEVETILVVAILVVYILFAHLIDVR